MISQKTCKNTIQNATKVCSLVAATVFGVMTIFAPNVIADDTIDTLTSPHQTSTFTHFYENSAPDDAPGYFLISLETLFGMPIADTIELLEIKETFPLDTNNNPQSGATVRTIPVADASFIDSSGNMTIILTPQHPDNGGCVPNPAGGCTFDLNGNDGWDPDTLTLTGDTGDGFLDEDGSDTMIPTGVRGKIEITAALKTSANTSTSIYLDQGGVKFPNGFHGPAEEWRMTVQHALANDVLDPDASNPDGELRGPGGTGEPVEGQPYTVVVEGLTAVDGSPLNAPNGTCSTEINSTTYTGTGVTNGNCVVNIPVNASGDLDAGAVDVSDGGTPRDITAQAPYDAKSFSDSNDIPALTFSCNSATVGGTTTCSFDLPSGTLLANDFKVAVGDDATPGGTCATTTAPTVECTNIPVGNNTGMQNVYAQIGSDPKVDTGEDVNVIQAEIGNADVPALVVACEPTTTATTTCKIQLDDDQTLPANFKLSTGGAPAGGDCVTNANNIVTCSNVPADTTNPGEQPIFAQIGSDVPVNTGEEIFTITTNDLGTVGWSFNPGKGGDAPLFKSNDDISVTTTDFINLHDPSLEDSYTCTIQARVFQPKSGGDAWQNLGTGIAYDTTNGCSATLTKAIRGTKLNWSVKTTITNTDTSASYEFEHDYAFRFQGAGVIF